MKTSTSSDKLKSSPSVEKLSKMTTSIPTVTKESPPQETFKTPIAPKTVSKNLPKTDDAGNTTKTPAQTDQNKNISVAQKVAAIQQVHFLSVLQANRKAELTKWNVLGHNRERLYIYWYHQNAGHRAR